MTKAPELTWRLRAEDAKSKLAAERAESARLRAELARTADKYTAELNQNNSLWNALAKLPGGLEAARRLTR